MDLTSGTLITLKEKKYIIMETLIHDDKKYAFTNEVKEEEVTEEYYIFEIIEEKVKLITDEKLINALLPKFQEKLRKLIEEFL